MRKPRKYDYLLVLQGRYGFGWEDLCAADQTRTVGDRCRCDGADHSDLDGGTADGRDYT